LNIDNLLKDTDSDTYTERKNIEYQNLESFLDMEEDKNKNKRIRKALREYHKEIERKSW
jgi:hypothetical protein